MYCQGLGLKKDYMQAVKWFRLAGFKCNADAQYCMGLLYQGLLCPDWKEVPKDYPKAMNWYLLSATQKHADAQYNLGGMNLEGLGTPQNFKEALRLFRLSAKQGVAEAQFALGLMY